MSQRGWGIFLVAVAAGFGQEKEPEDASVVIRSTTSLVQVRVVAEDSRGKPVADLQRGDFQIFDERKPQALTFFSADRGAAAQAGATSEPGAGAAVSVESGPGYSLIVMDWLNTAYTDRIAAQEHLIRLLKGFQPRQQVAIYLMGRESRLIHDFTSDTPELIEAVQQAGLEPETFSDVPAGRFDARAGPRMGPRPSMEEQLFFLNNRINDSFHTLELIAGHLSHVPGRKSLIWLSAAFPFMIDGGVINGAKPGEVSYLQNLQALLGKLNRADVAVYPVDATGLAVAKRSYPGTMMQLAERTGGIMFGGRNDLDVGMRLALEDMRISYVLGFAVPAGAAAGPHAIRVKVNRPGVNLRYRESYLLAEPVPAK